MKKKFTFLSMITLIFMVSLSHPVLSQNQDKDQDHEQVQNQNEQDCSICCNPFSKETGVSREKIHPPCCKNNHKFHHHCLKKWIRGQRALRAAYDRNPLAAPTCPNCRQDLSDEIIEQLFPPAPTSANDYQNLSNLFYSVYPFYKKIYTQVYPRDNGPIRERPWNLFLFSPVDTLDSEVWKNLERVRKLYKEMRSLEKSNSEISNQFMESFKQLKKVIPFAILSYAAFDKVAGKVKSFSELNIFEKAGCVLTEGLGVATSFFAAKYLLKSLSHIKTGLADSFKLPQHYKNLRENFNRLRDIYQELEFVLDEALEDQVNLPSTLGLFYFQLRDDVKKKLVLIENSHSS